MLQFYYFFIKKNTRICYHRLTFSHTFFFCSKRWFWTWKFHFYCLPQFQLIYVVKFAVKLILTAICIIPHGNRWKSIAIVAKLIVSSLSYIVSLTLSWPILIRRHWNLLLRECELEMFNNLFFPLVALENKTFTKSYLYYVLLSDILVRNVAFFTFFRVFLKGYRFQGHHFAPSMVDSWSEIEKKMSATFVALYQYDYTFIITLYCNKMDSLTHFHYYFIFY